MTQNFPICKNCIYVRTHFFHEIVWDCLAPQNTATKLPVSLVTGSTTYFRRCVELRIPYTFNAQVCGVEGKWYISAEQVRTDRIAGVDTTGYIADRGEPPLVTPIMRPLPAVKKGPRISLNDLL